MTTNRSGGAPTADLKVTFQDFHFVARPDKASNALAETPQDVHFKAVAQDFHFKAIARQVSRPGDTLYVIVGSLQTHNKRDAIRNALEDVCSQIAYDRVIVPCIWDAPSAWGIQVADYGLWAVQRIMEERPCKWYETCVQPTLRTTFTPWGRA